MSLSESSITAAIQTVIDPNTGRDFVTGKQVRHLKIDGSEVSFEIELGYPAKSQVTPMKRALFEAVRAVTGVENVNITITTKVAAHAVQRGVQLLPGVKNIIAVASGKGGVGKSTVAV